MIVGRYFQVKIAGGYDGETRTEQVSLVETADFGYVSSCQHADSDAYIPRSQIGRGGSAALFVRGQVDKQRVVGRKHNAETYAQHQCYAEKQDAAHRGVPLDEIDTASQQEKTGNDQIKPRTDDLCDFSVVYQPSGEQT